MRSRRASVASAATSLVAALALALAPSAVAEETPFVEWTSLLPGLGGEYDPSSSNLCTAGDTKCVDAVIREMDKRFKPLARTCHHNAIFSLAYLRTTEEYRRTIDDPDFFNEVRWVNHYDAVFAKYYFDAYDDWAEGRRSQVSQSWLIAFDAARDERIAGFGNLALGMNAHIQRDLPYVLAQIGLVRPDGSSRKDDHDRVNEFLNRVPGPLFEELARRFDPTIDDSRSIPTFIDDIITFQQIPAWREAAWRRAEALVNAPTPEARALVEAEIEANAASTATAIRTASLYPPLLGGAAARNAHCAENWNAK